MNDASPRPRKKLAIAVSAVIALFWVAMMTTLYLRDIRARRLPTGGAAMTTDELLAEWYDLDECMEVFRQGASIGALRTRVERQADGSFLASSQLRLKLSLSFITASIASDATASLDKELTLEAAALDATGAGMRLRCEAAVVDGDDGAASLLYLIRRGASSQGARVALEERPSFYQVARSLLVRQDDLAVGKTYALPAFDPLWRFGGGVATVSVTAREEIAARPDAPEKKVEAFRVETEFNDITTVSWVDDAGRALRQEFGRGIVFARMSPREAEERFPDFAKPLAPPSIDYEVLAEVADTAVETPDGAGAFGMLNGLFSQQ